MTPTCAEKTYPASEPQITGWLRTIYAIEPVIAVMALIILMPFLAAIAAATIAISRRNPFIRHNRVGWRGTPLRMLKFRTMWAEDDTPAAFFLIEDVSGVVPAMKFNGDARVKSRFAAFCRRHSLDELPQLYHVAQGEMSLVGPRPITRTELNEHYGDSTDEVLSLRPGLTGLWQVNGRNRLSYPGRRRLDLFFVRNASAGLYFQILLRSVVGVFSGRDAY